MTDLYLKIGAAVMLVILGFGSGWGVNGWRLNSALANEKTAHAQDMKSVSDASAKAILEYQQKQAADLKRIADISDQYQGELNRAKLENDDLLSRVNAGSTRLLIAAHCAGSGNTVSTPSAAALGTDAARAELDPTARPAYYALREALDGAQAQVKGLQDYIRTIQ